jgi:hypothetical protein
MANQIRNPNDETTARGSNCDIRNSFVIRISFFVIDAPFVPGEKTPDRLVGDLIKKER